MANKASGGINKSAAIRDLYRENPELKVKEVVSTLAAKGIDVGANLVYLVKGTLKGRKKHRREVNQAAVRVAATSGSTDAVKTILKVKAVANEVGGLKNLKALVEALSA